MELFKTVLAILLANGLLYMFFVESKYSRMKNLINTAYLKGLIDGSQAEKLTQLSNDSRHL